MPLASLYGAPDYGVVTLPFAALTSLSLLVHPIDSNIIVPPHNADALYSIFFKLHKSISRAEILHIENFFWGAALEPPNRGTFPPTTL